MATLLTVGFLMLGTGGTLALSGGAGAGGSAASASFDQYRPVETPPVSVPPATTVAPAPAPPAPAPPAPAPKLAPAAALSTHGVATVSCPDVCHITLRARHGSRLVHVTVTLNANGTTTVRLTKRELRRLGRGSVVVSVYVDGKVIATRRVRLS